MLYPDSSRVKEHLEEDYRDTASVPAKRTDVPMLVSNWTVDVGRLAGVLVRERSRSMASLISLTTTCYPLCEDRETNSRQQGVFPRGRQCQHI
jgi:hypothetical protein